MFRTPHMKACVHQLRFHRLEVMLGDARIVCSRSSGVTEHMHPARICISAHFLSTHWRFSSFNWMRTPKTLFLCLHGSMSGSPSVSKCLLPRSNMEKCPNPPAKRQSSCVLQGVRGHARGLHRDAQAQAQGSDCLSAGNEARCRRSLLANGPLYEREGKSWAAVLVCLCAESGRPALLFTLRSAKLKGRHKGDVSFAGGKKDPCDRSVVDTALREAREELGVRITEDQVWGVMKPLRDMSGMMIAPVIANLGPLETISFRPNPSEVEEIFTLTLEHLCQAQNRGYTHFRTGDRYGYTLPVFHSPKYRVWGLTAVALDHALKLIVPLKHLLDHSTLTTEAAC